MSLFRIITALAFLGSVFSLQADLFDAITKEVEKTVGSLESTGERSGSSSLSQSEIASGLKAALKTGTEHAIAQLGQADGYYGDVLVRIAVPEDLQVITSTLRQAGMGQYVDDFERSMNRAAEQAVPHTAEIFGEAITSMSLDDARKILQGPDDAATEYFRGKSGTQLFAAIRPIVSEYTERTDVTRTYKQMVGAYEQYAEPMIEQSGLGMLMRGDKTPDYNPKDLDGYITAKGLDGLFSVVAEEEKKIREDPVARTTEILKKVFGSL
jgi:hypothetical protein